jgi:hypothetical protein
VSAAAAAGVNGAPRILTFVIGVGHSLSSLNAIAKAGGSGNAHIVDDDPAKAQQEFLDALNSIRGTVLLCEYTIPQPSTGTIDPDKINVSYTPSGGQPVTIGRVGDVSACDATAGGWYYDVPGAPTNVIMCPATCDVLKSSANGQAQILFGCKTQTGGSEDGGAGTSDDDGGAGNSGRGGSGGSEGEGDAGTSEQDGNDIPPIR